MAAVAPAAGLSPGRTFVLAPWTTVRGNSGTAINLVQDEGEWFDCGDFVDGTFQIDVAEVTNPTGAANGYVLLFLESSPTADESAFKVIVGPIPLFVTAATSPIIAKSASAGPVPLAGKLRWRIVPTGPASTFDATFRIRVSLNRQFYFAPTMFGTCVFWLRADRGLSFTNQTVTGWADQSGINDLGRSLVAGSSPPVITNQDGSYGSQMTVAFSGNANCYFANPSIWNPAIAQPKTWVLVGHRTSTAGTNYFMDGNSSGAGDAFFVSSTGVLTSSSGTSLNSATGNFWNAPPSAFLFESLNPTSTAYQINNFSGVLATGSAGTNGFNSVSLGVHSLAFGGGSNWVGTMAEVIALSGTLSSANKGLLKTYLNNRYAMSIT